MAMFLSRIKKALNLGTKSITANGTYNASTDGYDGYSSVEVNVPQITPASITPSNASPASLTADTPVNPTANGYAIESYSEVEPAYNHDVSLSIGNIYKAALSGKFVPNVININPTNASPVTLSYPYVYRNIAEYGGVAIGGYVDKTPSDSNPPSISSGAIIKASASGYLYSTIQKFKQGSVTLNTSNPTKVTLGFKPKYLCAYSTSAYYSNIWIDTMASNKYIRATTSGPKMGDWNDNYTGGLASIDNDGFTLRKSNSTGGLTYQYFAIG